MSWDQARHMGVAEAVYWRYVAANPTAFRTADNVAYTIGTGPIRGFGGHDFVVRVPGREEVRTTNLRHNGTVPAAFQDLIPTGELKF